MFNLLVNRLIYYKIYLNVIIYHLFIIIQCLGPVLLYKIRFFVIETVFGTVHCFSTTKSNMLINIQNKVHLCPFFTYTYTFPSMVVCFHSMTMFCESIFIRSAVCRVLFISNNTDNGKLNYILLGCWCCVLISSFFASLTPFSLLL